MGSELCRVKIKSINCFCLPFASGATTGNGSPDPHWWRQPAGLHGPPEETGRFQLCIDVFVPPHREEWSNIPALTQGSINISSVFVKRIKPRESTVCAFLILLCPYWQHFYAAKRGRCSPFLIRKQVTFVVLFMNLLFMRNGSGTLEPDCPYVSNIKIFISLLYVMPLLNAEWLD